MYMSDAHFHLLWHKPHKYCLYTAVIRMAIYNQTVSPWSPVFSEWTEPDGTQWQPNVCRALWCWQENLEEPSKADVAGFWFVGDRFIAAFSQPKGFLAVKTHFLVAWKIDMDKTSEAISFWSDMLSSDISAHTTDIYSWLQTSVHSKKERQAGTGRVNNMLLLSHTHSHGCQSLQSRHWMNGDSSNANSNTSAKRPAIWRWTRQWNKKYTTTIVQIISKDKCSFCHS